MDRRYWESYYALQHPSEQPSDFARFCADRYKTGHGTIFDIGCGNARDTLFFSSRSIPCIGIDQCSIAISVNEAKKTKLGLSAMFCLSDFCACDYDTLSSGGYSIYSRFTLHAIDYDEEKRLFDHLNNGKALAYFFIEARSIRDGLYGQGEEVGRHEFVTSHYRRFIDPEGLRAKLESSFDIEYFVEAQGFAKTDTEDPCLIRVIARRR